jgi:hypothetical protein
MPVSLAVWPFAVNLTGKQLYFRLARIKDCAAIRGPPPQPDILNDVLGLRRAPRMRCSKARPLSGTTSVVWGSPGQAYPKYTGSRDGTRRGIASDQQEGYAECTRVW